MITTLDAKGGVVIPASYLKEMGLKPGDEVFLTLENGELVIRKVDKAIKRAQSLVQSYAPEDRSLSNESIEEHREMDCE